MTTIREDDLKSDAGSSVASTVAEAELTSGSLDKSPNDWLKGTKGRFSDNEKKFLFDLIRGDSELFSVFLHQRKERMYGTKSWMHEIANRYNKLATKPRTLEAIRHHLMFRKGNANLANDEFLRKHSKRCNQQDTCTKCLIFQRSCVSSKTGRCGVDSCVDCDPELPHVDDAIRNVDILKPVEKVNLQKQNFSALETRDVQTSLPLPYTPLHFQTLQLLSELNYMSPTHFQSPLNILLSSPLSQRLLVSNSLAFNFELPTNTKRSLSNWDLGEQLAKIPRTSF